MTTLYYSRAKLVFSGAFLLIVAPLLGMLCMLGDPLDMIFGVGLILGGPLLSAGRVARLFGDLKAIEYDDRQVHLYPLGMPQQLAWREVTAIEVNTRTQYIYGIIPIRRQHAIRFSHAGGTFGRARISIPFNLLAADKSEVIARLTAMEKLRGGDGFITGAARVSKKALSNALAAPRTDQAPAGDFDADAVMARYLAQRAVGLQEAEPPAPAKMPPPLPPRMPPRVAGFGRKRG